MPWSGISATYLALQSPRLYSARGALVPAPRPCVSCLTLHAWLPTCSLYLYVPPGRSPPSLGNVAVLAKWRDSDSSEKLQICYTTKTPRFDSYCENAPCWCENIKYRLGFNWMYCMYLACMFRITVPESQWMFFDRWGKAYRGSGRLYTHPAAAAIAAAAAAPASRLRAGDRGGDDAKSCCISTTPLFQLLIIHRDLKI